MKTIVIEYLVSGPMAVVDEYKAERFDLAKHGAVLDAIQSVFNVTAKNDFRLIREYIRTGCPDAGVYLYFGDAEEANAKLRDEYAIALGEFNYRQSVLGDEA